MAKVTLLFGSEPQGEFGLDKPEMTIGRSRDCDIVVDNLGVSRHHCSIVQAGGDQYKIVDRGSNNGTFVNDKQVDGEAVLNDRDRIVLGKFSLVFDPAGSVDHATQEAQQAQAKGMGSEMTMFVDPDAIKQMQEKIKSGEGAARRVLAVNHGGRELSCALVKNETTIGKGFDADVPVKGLFVKPVQAKVLTTNDGHRRHALGAGQ